MKPDIDIKRDVEEELRLNPDIDATDIAVAVKNGVVTLSGFVRSYSQRWRPNAPSSASTALPAWPTTSRCDCRFQPAPGPGDRPGRRRRHPVRTAIFVRAHPVVVRDGWLTLEGQVEWNYAKDRAGKCRSAGPRGEGVTDLITVSPRVPAVEVRRKIEEAFRRSAELDANDNRRDRWRCGDAARIRSILG